MVVKAAKAASHLKVDQVKVDQVRADQVQVDQVVVDQAQVDQVLVDQVRVGQVLVDQVQVASQIKLRWKKCKSCARLCRTSKPHAIKSWQY